jgi:DNA-directed RNA polymerase subunit RPC12/RpoP
MTSKDVSFLSGIKDRKEGIEMLNTLQKQIDTKNEHVECRLCGEKMQINHYPYHYYYYIGGQEKQLKILNAPYYECVNCNHKVISGGLYANIEKIVEEEIFIRLNNRQLIPDEIDFSEFITKV